MVWLGGVMCKLTVAAFLPLQMAENHLNLPTQVQFFTLTSFISSSTSFTSCFSWHKPLADMCHDQGQESSQLNSDHIALQIYPGCTQSSFPPPITPHPAAPQVRWMDRHFLFTFSRERLLTSKYFQDALLHLLPPF